MDWFSWLSKTNLDPTLVYEYGLAFARNELQSDDLLYFNHEFLQSMGISVAKHRLEILKLARKDRDSSSLTALFHKTRRRLNKYLAKLVSPAAHQPAIKAAPQATGAFLRKWTSDKDLGAAQDRAAAQAQYRPKKRIALSGPLNGKAQERIAGRNARSLKLSGPLDGKAQERLMFPDRSPRFPTAAKVSELRLSGPLDGKLFLTSRSPKFSGPLDGRMQEKLMMMPPTVKSPKVSGPLDGRAVSPMGYNNGNSDFEDHLIWAALFDDMKPT